jgi:hypothetical protein
MGPGRSTPSRKSAADNADIWKSLLRDLRPRRRLHEIHPQSSGVAGYLLENGNLNGYTCHKSNQVAEDAGPTGNLFFGNWADLLIAIWGEGVEVIVDPYSQAANAQIALTAFLTCDVNVRTPSRSHSPTIGQCRLIFSPRRGGATGRPPRRFLTTPNERKKA